MPKIAIPRTNDFREVDTWRKILSDPQRDIEFGAGSLRAYLTTGSNSSQWRHNLKAGVVKAFTAENTSLPSMRINMTGSDIQFHIKDDTTSEWDNNEWDSITVINEAGKITMQDGARLLLRSDASIYSNASKEITLDDGTGGNLTKITAQTVELNIIGTADKYTHAVTTKTMTVGTMSARLSSYAPAVISDSNGWIVPAAFDDTDDIAIIPLVLPVGAIVARLDIWGNTAATPNGTVTVDLERRDVSGVAWATMATAIMTNTATTANDTTISNATITAEYEYDLLIKVKALVATSNAKFYGAKVTYTIADLAKTI